MKLNSGQRHLLRLVKVGQACPDGWAPVSMQVFPLVKALPAELVELHSVGNDGRGRAQLTPKGGSILDAMDWL